MPHATRPSTNESAFVLSALRENLRLDSRALDQYRPISLKFSSDPDVYGQTDVRMGKTRVICNVSCEVITPYSDRKFDGVFNINCELSPLIGAGVEIGRPDQAELLLSRLLEKSIRRSNALDTESLCIIAGQKCFHVRADLHVLDHDGSILDACCLALVAALQHFRRPDYEVHGEQVTVFDVREREPVKLTLQHQPFCVTTSYYDAGTIMVQDATLLEEQCREGEIVVSMNRHGEVCQIAKYGGVPVDALSVLSVVKQSWEKVKMMDSVVREALSKDERERDKGGRMKAELSAENERVMERPVG
ncbi:3'-5'-exoribonuclease [Friedmanniomyces endolithicus]|uniref:Exosome complex component RRP45 n=1 Tax=Friedmanniomyces endolithicus TaxID=329885 RepID=A0AAN6KAX1_9PEZI|nr:3'-5'-exoribonuclease [Friedmanniomyces endolithicus]KAK0972931.1 3'-5'-exoribonuclease [Friedmanniomyces endolithicus]KAK0989629.1 3'-5'-exoribonuclease [Friedmanniomyces endolithicus]KAK1044172.1 3'-5'-exoribonuclease [Friedmanniomyces endolithicus]